MNDFARAVGRPIGRSQNRSVAKERLLDAALLVFAQSGFDGASIRGITRLLGMRESGFYAHFPSKQAAYDALFEEGGPAVVTRWVSTLSASEAPDVALRKLAAEIMESWAAPRARLLASVVLREVFAGHGEKRADLLAGVDTAMSETTHLLTEWQQRGAVRSDTSAESLAFTFLAPLTMLRILHFNQASTTDELRHGDVLVARHVETFLVLAGAMPPQTVPASR